MVLWHYMNYFFCSNKNKLNGKISATGVFRKNLYYLGPKPFQQLSFRILLQNDNKFLNLYVLEPRLRFRIPISRRRILKWISF